MADVLTSEQRHRNMQHIRSRDTKPEIVLRKALWKKGYRYRKNWKELPGKPDIVLTKYKVCIFVDSEFFHGQGFNGGYHSNKYKSLEEQLKNSTNPDFWLNKIRRNMQRDEEVNAVLADLGWKVFRFWSRDVLKSPESYVSIIEDYIQNK